MCIATTVLQTIHRPEMTHIKHIVQNASFCQQLGSRLRRIRMGDVMSYKAAIESELKTFLDQLTANAQEQDMGYSER